MLRHLLGQWKTYKKKPPLLPEDGEAPSAEDAPHKLNPIFEDSDGSLSSLRQLTGDQFGYRRGISVDVDSDNPDDVINQINIALGDNDVTDDGDSTSPMPEIEVMDLPNAGMSSRLHRMIELNPALKDELLEASRENLSNEIARTASGKNEFEETTATSAKAVIGTSRLGKTADDRGIPAVAEKNSPFTVSHIKDKADQGVKKNKPFEMKIQEEKPLQPDAGRRGIGELIKKFQGTKESSDSVRTIKSFLHSRNRVLHRTKQPQPNPEPSKEVEKESLSEIFTIPPPPPPPPPTSKEPNAGHADESKTSAKASLPVDFSQAITRSESSVPEDPKTVPDSATDPSDQKKTEPKPNMPPDGLEKDKPVKTEPEASLEEALSHLPAVATDPESAKGTPVKGLFGTPGTDHAHSQTTNSFSTTRQPEKNEAEKAEPEGKLEENTRPPLASASSVETGDSVRTHVSGSGGATQGSLKSSLRNGSIGGVTRGDQHNSGTGRSSSKVKHPKRAKKGGRRSSSSPSTGDYYFDVLGGRPREGSVAADLTWEEAEIIRRLRSSFSNRSSLATDVHLDGHLQRQHPLRRTMSDAVHCCPCQECWLSYVQGTQSQKKVQCTCRFVPPDLQSRKVQFRSASSGRTSPIPEEGSIPEKKVPDEKESANTKELPYVMMTPRDVEAWNATIRKNELLERRKRARCMALMGLAMVVLVGLLVAALMLYLRRKVLL